MLNFPSTIGEPRVQANHMFVSKQPLNEYFILWLDKSAVSTGVTLCIVRNHCL